MAKKKSKKKPKQQRTRAHEIIVAVDGSDPSDAAVRWAACESLLRSVPLKLVHIVGTPTVTRSLMPVPVAAGQWQDAHARQIVDGAADLVQRTAKDVGAAADIAGAEIYHSAAIPTLIGLSERAKMIVVGSRGHGALRRGLLGSVSSGLVYGARCPVAVIHDHATPAADAPVVVGIDGSQSSELATRIAFEEAAERRVELVAVHAWSDVDLREVPDVDWDAVAQRKVKLLEKRLSGWCERYADVKVRRVVVRDQPAVHLAEQAENAQLLVVGSRGRGGFAGLMLGSVSSMLTHYVQIPMIVARQG
jgi:nucleotide-binding universal stress UspA family protein